MVAFRKAFIAASLPVAVMAAMPGSSRAQQVDGSVHACMGLNSGTIRIVAVGTGCRTNEKPVQWNVAGPQGERGPDGPVGPAGPQGPTGPQGDPGTLQLAGQRCPAGTFVTGFNAEGRITCGAPAGGELPPDVVITPLTMQADQIRQRLLSLRGDEGAGLAPFEYAVLSGAVSGSAGLDGFAFCEPPNPAAPPAAEPPLYGCSPAVNVQFAAYGADSAKLTIDVPAIFLAAAGQWRLEGLVSGSGPIDGHVLFRSVHVELNVPILNSGAGTREFGTPTVARVTYSADPNFEFGDSVVGSFMSFLANQLLSMSLQWVLDGFLYQLKLALPALTPPVL